MVTREIDHHSQIADAATTDGIIEALDAFGHSEVVVRLRYLRVWTTTWSTTSSR